MRFGSIRISRTSSGVERSRIDVRIVLMQPDLPEPVVPAMSRCGMRARSVQTALPEMSLPSHTETGLAVCGHVAVDVAERDEVRAQVRDLDADGLLAGDRREDADLGRRERVGEVVLQRRDLRHLRAGRKLELVARHARARDLAGDVRLDPEVTERRDECACDLVVGVGGSPVARRRAAQQCAVRQAVVAVQLGRGQGELRGKLVRLLGDELDLLRALQGLRLAHDVREGGGRVDGRLVRRGDRRQLVDFGRCCCARARGWPAGRAARAADDVVRAAQQRADRGAREQQDARDRRGHAQEDAAGAADEAADQRVEALPDQPRARSEHEEEAEHDDRAPGAERPHVEQLRPRDEQAAERAEGDRQQVAEVADHAVEPVDDLLARRAAVPAEVEQRGQEEPGREQEEPDQLGTVVAARALLALGAALDPRRLARAQGSLLGGTASHRGASSTRRARPLRPLTWIMSRSASESERSKTGEGQDESCPSVLLVYRGPLVSDG